MLPGLNRGSSVELTVGGDWNQMIASLVGRSDLPSAALLRVGRCCSCQSAKAAHSSVCTLLAWVTLLNRGQITASSTFPLREGARRLFDSTTAPAVYALQMLLI